jgi:hypothetical protein
MQPEVVAALIGAGVTILATGAGLWIQGWVLNKKIENAKLETARKIEEMKAESHKTLEKYKLNIREGVVSRNNRRQQLETPFLGHHRTQSSQGTFEDG